MPYYFTAPSALVLPLDVFAADGNPHVTFDDLARAKGIMQWVSEQFERITPQSESVHCVVELMRYGHLEFTAEVSNPARWNQVDRIVRTARRASHGCCETCDNLAGIAYESHWLTALCDRCCQEQVADRVDSGSMSGESYDFAA